MKVKVFVLDGLKIHKHMIENGIFLNAQNSEKSMKYWKTSLTLNWSSDAEQWGMLMESLTLKEEEKLTEKLSKFKNSKLE